MSGLKSILCLFDGHRPQLSGLKLACAMSVHHKAFVHVLHVTEPLDPYLELDPKQETALLMSQTVDMHKIALLARDEVHRVEGGSWHGALDHDTFYETGVGFEALVAYTDKVIPRIARTTDLVICTKSPPTAHAGPDVFLSTLSRSGRPVLLVPSHPRQTPQGSLFDGIIAVAWDRSIQATRAIHNLMPFLGTGSAVHLISIAEHNKRIDVRDDAAIVHWLRRHGVVPIVHHLAQADQSVGAMLLHAAARIKADMLVAGAYGQNAVVEKLIGGTTIDMYRHATLPLFLTH
jgi:nucleotide-binding universal stress UspA family protein